MAIQILYDYQKASVTTLRDCANVINDRLKERGINKLLEIVPCDCWTFPETAKSQNWDVVIMHLGPNSAGAYRIAQDIKLNSGNHLVAESSMYPENEREVLESFDDYIPLDNKRRVIRLLEILKSRKVVPVDLKIE